MTFRLRAVISTLTAAVLVGCGQTDTPMPDEPTEQAPTSVPMTDTPAPSPASPEERPILTEESVIGEEPTEAPPQVADGQANADVTFVRAVQQNDSAWTFYVTVAHPDTGWEDYADGWDVVLPDGTVIKPNADDPFTRLLLHPHINEQPFTRSQTGIAIPEDVDHVIVRAHDLLDGWGGQEVIVDLTAAEGEKFEVVRT